MNKQLSHYLCRQLGILEKDYPYAKALRSSLRHDAGRHPLDALGAYSLLLQDMPEDFFGYEPVSRMQWASWITLCAAAKTNPSRKENTLPFARILAARTADEDQMLRLSRRLESLMNARSIEEFNRKLIYLLPFLGDDPAVDWPRLAGDILLWQSDKYHKNIKAKWAQDFALGIPYKGEKL